MSTTEMHGSDARNLLPEDVGDGEEALRDEHRVPSVPIIFPIIFQCSESVVSYDSEHHRDYVQRVRYEVDHVPHIVHVLLQAHVPQLFHLRPNQPRHPGQYKPAIIRFWSYL